MSKAFTREEGPPDEDDDDETRRRFPRVRATT